MKARILFWLKIGVSVGLLGYLLTLIDFPHLLVVSQFEIRRP